MSINFDLFNSREEVDNALDGYSDEELAYTYLELDTEFTLMDLTGVAKYIISTTFKPVEVFIVAGSIYLFLTFLIHNLVKFLEKKYSY